MTQDNLYYLSQFAVFRWVIAGSLCQQSVSTPGDYRIYPEALVYCEIH